MFDISPKCPTLTSKLSGIFGWRHTYKVSAKHDGITHAYLKKSYSLTLPKRSAAATSTSTSASSAVTVIPYTYVKDPNTWVSVHHLQTQSGILDPDDCVRDVADDREYIDASFEDSGPDPGVPQGGGDGASGSSSVGTSSPDIFRESINPHAGNNIRVDVITQGAPHIEVTSTTICPPTGLGLQVRRNSDPNLLIALKSGENANKRWSAAAPHCDESPERMHMEKNGYMPPQWEEDDDHNQHHNSLLVDASGSQAFARSGRLSMQFLGDGNGYKWLEAAEKLQNQQKHLSPGNHHQIMPSSHIQQQQQIFTSKSLPRESKRKEPLGQAYESIREKDGEMLLLINEYGSPLGLTAMPDKEHEGGLLVHHVEPGGRAERGRLRRGDRILEINGTKLVGLAENKVQECLRRALETSELRVRVIRAGGKGSSKSRKRDSKVAEMIEAEEKMTSSLESKVATVSPTRVHNVAPTGSSLQLANTRKLGQKIEIILKKGPNGLGFSVTTRDNPAGGHCPIYIKNILPRGAAIEDGRLKPGDRLLEVDSVPMTGKTQTEVVSILRATKPGASVHLMVSRQQELAEQEEREVNFEHKEKELKSPPTPPAPILPQSVPKPKQVDHDTKKIKTVPNAFHLNESQHFIDAGSESAASTDSIQAGITWRSREMLTFHIPVHDTEKAGLGVSVKGKTSSNLSGSSNSSNTTLKHDGDLGIFVKNVLHGGAASRDGRLRMNDQLISVNGVTLLGQSNAAAMETLKRAIVKNPGKHPGMITLQIARKVPHPASTNDSFEHPNESSNTSENSGTTVIYLSPDKKANCNTKNSIVSGDNTTNDMNRWSNPVLDRLTGGVCSSNSSQRNRIPNLSNCNTPHNLRNESYYMATHDTWSPTLANLHNNQNKHGGLYKHNGCTNAAVLIEDDPEPKSPTLPHCSNELSLTSNVTSNGSTVQNFDATYSSQLSLETNNSSVEHFSRDALGRRSISEKHHAALDARETGTYQRNKRLREERERRLQLTKSAVFSGSMESITAHMSQANAQIPGYKHMKTASGAEQQQLLSEAQDEVGDLGPSLGLKKSSSLESLQTMVQEIQMSDESRLTTLRAPRGRGREEYLRAAVTNDHNTNKARKHWLLEDGDPADGGFAQRNGLCQSSMNDGKNKPRAKKNGILRGIGSMFRFGKNRKDSINESPPLVNTIHSSNERLLNHNQIPTAALAALERNSKLAPPAYQPPPPLPLPISNTNDIASTENVNLNESTVSNNNAGIHQNDIFNHRYPHYPTYEELQHTRQHISDDNSDCLDTDVLSESTIECMRKQVLQQRHKVESESRRHQHYHSQRSARSQELNLPANLQTINNNNNNNNNKRSNNNNTSNNSNGNANSSNNSRTNNNIYCNYESVQHTYNPNHQHNHNHSFTGHDTVTNDINHKNANSFHHRSGSIKQNSQATGDLIAGSKTNTSGTQMQLPTAYQAHWKTATLNGFSPASLNSSARSRGPFVTHVTLGPATNRNKNNSLQIPNDAQQHHQQQQQQQSNGGQHQQNQSANQPPTYQTVQKHTAYTNSLAANGQQHTASKV